MFTDPVVEQFRLNPSEDGYTGLFTLAYPSKSICIALVFTSTTALKLSQVKQLIEHVKQTNRTTLVFYRDKRGVETQRVINLGATR